jgi:hypothetical protein
MKFSRSPRRSPRLQECNPANEHRSAAAKRSCKSSESAALLLLPLVPDFGSKPEANARCPLRSNSPERTTASQLHLNGPLSRSLNFR